MSEEKIILLEKKNGVGIITLNRADKLNALTDELTFALQDALKEMEKDDKVKVIVLTGAGRGFCAGQDLQARSISQNADQRPSLGDSIRRRYNPIILRMRKMEKLIIGAVNGVAAGAGASLALGCDLRIASETASFIQSFCKIGLIPDSGSTFMMPRLIGSARALELMLSSDKLDAAEALRLGLVNRVVAQDQVLPQAIEWAEKLAKGPSKAYALTKRAVNKAIFSDLEDLLENEAQLQEIAGRTDDFIEGVKAFGEKRQPVYTGK